MTKDYFGTTKDGSEISCFRLTSASGMEAHILNYGAIIHKLLIPVNAREKRDVVLGFKNLEGYEKNDPYFGILVGRNANRIAGGQTTIEGKSVQLSQNEGKHQLHGGHEGFGHKVWDAEMNGEQLVLSYLSKDGEEGYPGNLQVKATFQWQDNDLVITHQASTDKETIVNLSRHEYWNLSQSENIKDHHLKINADAYLPKNEENIPTGEIKTVENSPMDFRESVNLSERIAGLPEGYDHNFVLNERSKTTPAAVLQASGGLKLQLYATQPGLQFFTAPELGPLEGKYGTIPAASPALCLEPQHFPDTPNHENFPSTLLKPGERYDHLIIYNFEMPE